MGSLTFNIVRGFTDDVGFDVVGATAPALVLDGERGELVRAPAARLGKKGLVSEAKVAMALKSHSEAERRRRERINAHLSTLRSLVPSADKLDKAALLAEVITHLRELKNGAMEVSKGCNVPADIDEVEVNVEGDGMYDGTSTIRVSLCCEDRPELLTDLKQTLQSLRLRIVKAEISTLGGRVKHFFVMTCEGNGDDIEHHLLANSVRRALKAVIDGGASSAPDLSAPSSSLPNKRRRVSPFESSSSSS